MSVEVKGFSKIYDSETVVDNITFSAKKGQITGFLGPNGAGKSTTMKVITCYTPPSLGEVEVCDLNVSLSPLEVRKKIGYLPEHNPLYLDMYVHEYLHTVASFHQLKGLKAKQRVSEMVEICGLTKEQNKQIGQLSKGYRQRVGLAQALVHDPEVLILDEPTTGLDPNQLVEIRSLIKKVSQDKTVILSTHIMQEVQALCDNVVIINKGKLVANDTVNEVIQYNQSSQTIELLFSESIQLSDIEGFNQNIRFNQINENKWILSSNEESDIRTELIKYLISKGLPLQEIKQTQQTLEEVFRNVTK